QLGADLPICMAARPLVARGNGEAVTPVDGQPALAMVLVNPRLAVPTPATFRAHASHDNAPMAALPARPAFSSPIDWPEPTHNDLGATAAALAPQITDTLAAFRHHGAAMARMSGCGATCFGLYPSTHAAERAAQAIANAEPSWYVSATG